VTICKSRATETAVTNNSRTQTVQNRESKQLDESQGHQSLILLTAVHRGKSIYHWRIQFIQALNCLLYEFLRDGHFRAFGTPRRDLADFIGSFHFVHCTAPRTCFQHPPGHHKIDTLQNKAFKIITLIEAGARCQNGFADP
jgi:hypothetical protein